MLDLSRFWNPEQSSNARAKKSAFEAWETQHGVLFPKLLRKVYREHNGGVVRDSQFRLFPLAEITQLDDDFWDMVEVDEDDAESVENRSLIFKFACDDAVDAQYYLNYNTAGPQADPSIWEVFSDPAELTSVSDSTTRFFKRMLRVSDTPAFDWAEINALKIIAEETIDESYWLDPGSTTHNILAHDDKQLIFYVHAINEDGVRYEKTILPLPLAVDMPICNRHDDQTGPWTLHLEPEESDRIISWESNQTADKRWKSERSTGVPIYSLFESWDKAKLAQLRELLIGVDAAQAASEQDAADADLQAKMATASPDELDQMGVQMMVAVQGMINQMPQSMLGQPPPELARMADMLQQQMQTIMQQMQQQAGDEPVAPEIAAVVEQMKKRLQGL